MTVPRPILPGATIGVFGGGQLGRMFCHAATRMGYRTVVYAPDPDCPASHACASHVCALYDDQDRIASFAQQCDAVTVEFENIPTRCLELASRHTLTRPGAHVLAIAQDRLEERRFLDAHAFPAAPHASVTSEGELSAAIDAIGPGVLKSARLGYDGRGQCRVSGRDDATEAWRTLNTDRALYEAWVEYTCEVSVLVARSPQGETRAFGPIENHHANHILDISVIPARIDASVADAARDLAETVATAIELEGLICVEMFVTPEETLLINEIAPRPHNSGHLTIETCGVSQFEQQVRAMCGLPLGDMRPHSAAAMKNLLGDLWKNGTPNWTSVLDAPGTHLHLYGKKNARQGRKMGHVTILGASADDAARKAGDLADRIVQP